MSKKDIARMVFSQSWKIVLVAAFIDALVASVCFIVLRDSTAGLAAISCALLTYVAVWGLNHLALSGDYRFGQRGGIDTQNQ